MPFVDRGGVKCLQLSDIWDEPLTVQEGDTCVPGASPRALRGKGGGARLAQFGRVAYFVVLDHGATQLSKTGWRYGPYPVGEGEDPQAVAMENSGELLEGRYSVLDEALDFALELNCAAGVMDS